MRALGAPFTDSERIAVVAAARAYLGTRWKHQGRTKRGIDCGGLLFAVMRDIGKTPVDAPPGYGREAYRHGLEAVLEANYGKPVDREPRIGDAVVFHVGRSAPNHCGIVGDYIHGGLSLIHAYAINGAVVEAPFDVTWRSLLPQVYSP